MPDHRASGPCDGLVGDEPAQAPSRSKQPQDYLIAVCADARMVASLMLTAIVNAISPYSIGVAALSSRVKRSSVAFIESLTIRAADIDSGRIKNVQTSTFPHADDERSVSPFVKFLTAAPARLRRSVRHSITSSAATSSLSGTVRPSALAVLRLMTSSNLVGCTTGSSPGLAPLRMRPV